MYVILKFELDLSNHCFMLLENKVCKIAGFFSLSFVTQNPTFHAIQLCNSTHFFYLGYIETEHL